MFLVSMKSNDQLVSFRKTWIDANIQILKLAYCFCQKVPEGPRARVTFHDLGAQL